MARRALFVALILVSYMLYLSFPALPAYTYAWREAEGMEVLFTRDSLELDDVTGPRSDDFRPAHGNVVRFWNLSDELWIRLPMSNLREAERSFHGEKTILLMQTEYLFAVDFYMPTARGEFAHSASGIGSFLEGRVLPPRPPMSVLIGNYDEGYAYYKIRTNTPVSFSVVLVDEDGYYSLLSRFLTRYLVFYGFMMALILTCFFSYLITGDRGYYIVVLRQLGVFVFLFALNGGLLYVFCLLYSFTLPPMSAYIACWLGLGLHGLMQAFLCRHLMRTDEGPAWLKRLIYAHASLCVIVAVSSFWLMPYVTLSIAVLALAVDIASFVAVGFLRFRQGYRIVFLLVLSRLAFVLGIAALIAHVFFVWQTSFLESCFMVLFLLDPILLLLMMIPDTRQRFKSFFSLEDKETSYDTLSERDGVTGLYNKSSLMLILADKIKSAQKANNPLAFIVMDIDHFQAYNETWGHQEGDKLLIFLAKLTKQCLRDSDIAARHAGGEFALILPGGTLPSAVLVAERIRQRVENYGSSLNKATTLSVGMSFLRQGDNVTELIQRSYEALRLAQSNGRNRTEFELSVQ